MRTLYTCREHPRTQVADPVFELKAEHIVCEQVRAFCVRARPSVAHPQGIKCGVRCRGGGSGGSGPQHGGSGLPPSSLAPSRNVLSVSVGANARHARASSLQSKAPPGESSKTKTKNWKLCFASSSFAPRHRPHAAGSRPQTSGAACCVVAALLEVDGGYVLRRAALSHLVWHGAVGFS